jgi:hypothetical protein
MSGSSKPVPLGQEDTQPASDPDIRDEASRVFDISETNLISKTTYTLTIDGTAAYFFESPQLQPGKPDLTLYAGAEGAGGAVLGVATFITLSSLTKLGLGDPAQPAQMVWEDMTKERINYSIYRWETTVQDNGGGGGGTRRRAFLWKRTHSVSAGKIRPSKLDSQCFKLVDEVSGELFASFGHHEWKSMTKTGQFEIRKSYGPEFDVMAILSLLAVFEKSRRRERRDAGLLIVEAGKRVIGSVMGLKRLEGGDRNPGYLEMSVK